MKPLRSPLESAECTLRTTIPGDSHHSEGGFSSPLDNRDPGPGGTQKHEELPKPVLLGIFLNIHPFDTFTDFF